MQIVKESPKNLMLVDDYGVVIEGLKALLDNEEKYNILEVAYTGEEAVEKVSDDIDLVIMDVNLPGMSGIEATAEIKKRHPDIKILAVSRHTDSETIKFMIKAGANGYIAKDFQDSPLEVAIDKILEGNPFLCNKAVEAIANLDWNKESPKKPSLSKRELEILKMLAKEQTNEQIAKKLFISRRTVESHRKNMMLKIGVHNLAGLFRYAYENGIIKH